MLLEKQLSYAELVPVRALRGVVTGVREAGREGRNGTAEPRRCVGLTQAPQQIPDQRDDGGQQETVAVCREDSRTSPRVDSRHTTPDRGERGLREGSERSSSSRRGPAPQPGACPSSHTETQRASPPSLFCVFSRQFWLQVRHLSSQEQEFL